MLASQRRDHILHLVRTQGAVRVTDIVADLDVSDMTVRRDISELADQGLLLKVHGGAVDIRRTVSEPGFDAKQSWATSEKTAIAQAGLRYISPGSAIALSGGTTTHLLATAIAQRAELRPLTVVTNSIPVSEVLHNAPNSEELEVVLTGGVRTPSDALVGPVADAALSQLKVDFTFLGVHALTPQGMFTPNIAEAQTDQKLIETGNALVVLADQSKWDALGLAKIAPLSAIDHLITDAVPKPAAESMRSLKIDVQIARAF